MAKELRTPGLTEGRGFALTCSQSRIDPRFRPHSVESFAPEFQGAYSLDELAELDLHGVARKQS